MKKKLAIFFAVLLTSVFTYSQQITRAEYFFNADPGYGNGTPISITGADSISIVTNIQVPDNLHPGIHVLYVRVGSENAWGFPQAYLVNISGSTTPIMQAEYFFNADPGFGNGIPISFSGADSISIITEIQVPDSLRPGIHLLYVRVGFQSAWGFPQAYLVNISGSTTPIVQAEYFWDTDPGFGNGTPVKVNTPADSMSVLQELVIPNLSAGEHTLWVRIKNESGTWSLIQQQKITICSTYGPLPKFEYHTEGDKVTFTNLSENAVSYHWNFGNGKSAETVNPLHTYTVPGNYKVILTATNNCGTQKDSSDIIIAGIQGISPQKGPVNGVYTGKISGSGLPAGSIASIQLEGGAIFAADTTIRENSSELQVTFNNKNLASGRYDVRVTIPGGHTFILEKALLLSAAEPFNIWANVTGPAEMLVNQWTKFSVVVGNNSNITAYGVPVLIGVPTSVKATITSELDTAYLHPVLKNEHPKGFFIATDTLTGEGQNMAYLLIPFIEPGKTAVVNLEVMNSTSDNFNIQLATSQPYYNGENGNFLYQNGMEENGATTIQNSLCDPPPCIQCLLDLASEFIPPAGCAIGIVDAGCNLYDDIKQQKSKKEKLKDLVLNVASAAAGCSPAPDPSTIKSLLGALKYGFSEGKKKFDFFSAAGGSCGSCFDPKNPKPIIMRFAWDPNDKTGPTGYNTNQYTTLGTGYPYLIQFENLPAATAPASTVVIEDVLDTLKLNSSSFRFTGFGFGDTAVSMDIADTLFFRDIDLRPAKNTIVRVKGHLQNRKKLVFQLSSLSPATMAATTVIDDGFLPPNTNGTEGLGFVSFLVDPKPDLPSGTLISNMASIIFDANAPIVTDDWINGIDKEKPQSKVRPDFEKLNDSTYVIKWSGSDTYSGLRHFRIFMSEDGGPYVEVILSSETEDTIVLKATGTFRFYSIATDLVGNIEEPPGIPDLTLSVILPVELLEFTAISGKNLVFLNWVTATELKNKGFEIERSSDGSRYEKVGWVNGKGNSTVRQQYHFTDYPGLAGTYYYRLRQVDLDQRYKYSPIRKVQFNAEGLFTVAPNPFGNNLSIYTDQPIERLIILDASGRILYESARKAAGNIQIATPDWPSGAYFIHLTSQKGNIETEKVIKL